MQIGCLKFAMLYISITIEVWATCIHSKSEQHYRFYRLPKNTYRIIMNSWQLGKVIVVEYLEKYCFRRTFKLVFNV